MKEENQKEAETVMVAVGVILILLVAGVKHGLTNLVEQWRALVFLFLNLLLLTIVFTSIRSNKAETHAGSVAKEEEEKKTVSDKKLKSSASSSWPVQVDDLFFEVEEETATVAPEPGKEEVVQVEAEAEADEGQQVSKEELNARVESFITMFRHQLALDAKEISRRSFSPVVSKGSPVTVR